MPGYTDLKKIVDTHYGTKCHDCDDPAETYYIDPDNPEKPQRSGRLGWEFYDMVVRQNFPETVMRVCRRHYLNRYQNDKRRRMNNGTEGTPTQDLG